ncbi:EF-hand domain-containing protein [Coraliomargarita algicola]|uniref:EF-hand domain-containing protein n=1 Tax=Coraliomargarita algicola TaxID=3092156 RepID=A0ABZ0RPK9_9BACT|nr:EF-hand domain-containing protein [Coraliomargarita sp. J2-16]WPJ97056.1 EF-hand domain-containing protein [Coraliomargarita sp. J2-16]
MNHKYLVILLLTAGISVTACAKNPGPDGKRPKPPTPEEFIQKLDKDGDGKVSQEEFDGPDEHFTQSDTNNDGYISLDEVPSGPPPRK